MPCNNVTSCLQPLFTTYALHAVMCHVDLWLVTTLHDTAAIASASILVALAQSFLWNHNVPKVENTW